MSIHRELADLVAAAGKGILLDAADFRAAFDDFVAEDLANEGDLNLLSDAIRLGAFQRVLDQIANGADPEHAIQLQAARLAVQRGTQEPSGARWALTVLNFAAGTVDETVLHRCLRDYGGAFRETVLPVTPMPPQPATPAPISPTVTEKPAPPTPPTGLPPAAVPPTALPPTVQPPQTVAAPPPPLLASPARQGRRGRRLLAAVVVLAVLGGGTAAGVLVLRGETPIEREPGPEPPTAQVLEPGTVISSKEVAPPGLIEGAVMGGRVGGVSVTGLGEVDALGTGENRSVAPEDHHLVAFTLAAGPCQAAKCVSWSRLGLEVVVGDDAPVALPSGGPSFVVVAPDGENLMLRFAADDVDQRLSLRTGRASKDNIVVLARSKRAVDLKKRREIAVTANVPLEPDDRLRLTVVRGARLFFFSAGKGLSRPDRAYLGIDVSYTTAADPVPSFFHRDHLRLLAPDGSPYEIQTVTDPVNPKAVVFVVPATFTRATLVIGGTTRVDTTVGGQPSSALLTVKREPFDVRISAR